MPQFEKIFRIILKNSLRTKPQESLLIIAEESLSDLGEVFWNCAKKITKYSVLIKFSYKYLNDHGLPTPIYNSLIYADSVIVLTPKIVIETLFDEARQNGTRIILLKNISKELMERSLETNYNLLANISRRLADIFTIGKTIHLTSPSGTDAKVNISSIKGFAETGLAFRAGDFTCLPAGEARVFLNKKNNIEGLIVLDRITGHKKPFSKPIMLKVHQGYISQIRGDKDAEQLRKDIRIFGKSGRKINELGVGTNENVALGNSALEDEKVSGTVHIALGQNQITKIHGKITQSIKGMILNPTLTIDGKLIIEDGKILVG
ncbi:MAG: hypothetical protein ACE5HX_15755 [bacterium]